MNSPGQKMERNVIQRNYIVYYAQKDLYYSIGV